MIAPSKLVAIRVSRIRTPPSTIDNVRTQVILFITIYIIGHILDSASGFCADNFLLKPLKGPQENLFKEPPKGCSSKWFPGYLKPFPKETQDRIIKKAESLTGASLFNHTSGCVRRHNGYKQRLDIQLNQYTFCRNISFISFFLLLINLFLMSPLIPSSITLVTQFLQYQLK